MLKCVFHPILPCILSEVLKLLLTTVHFSFSKSPSPFPVPILHKVMGKEMKNLHFEADF